MDLSDINVGAELAAAGKTLGMTPDETYDFVVKKIQQQNARRARQGQAPIDERAGFRSFLDKMARVRGIDEVYPADIDNYSTVDNSELIDNTANENQNFGGTDKQGRSINFEQANQERERAAGRRDQNLLTRTYFEKGSREPKTEQIYVEDGMPVPERFRESAMARDFGVYRTDAAAPAQQVLRTELARLQAGVDQFGADAFPGIADVIGRIEDDLQVNREAEASIAAELVRRDNQNVNLDVVEANDWRADAEAQRIARERFGINGGGVQADVNLGKIGDIDKIGPAKIGYDFGVSFPVPGRQVEPTSLPIGLASDLNAPVTDNRLAGPLQKQEQWLVDHAPGYREGRVFGDYPQVAIDAQLEGVSEALAKLKINGQGLEPADARVRNLNDLQNAVDKVIGLGGGKFFDVVDGRNVINENPGIEQVLGKLRFNENQQNDLARALFAIEAANRNPANTDRKTRFMEGSPEPRNREMGGRRLVAIEGADEKKKYYVVRRPAKETTGGAEHQLLGSGQVGVGRINREKIEGREVRTALQELDGRQADPPLTQQELRDARMPYQGAAGGEKPARAAFIKGDVRDMPREERARRFGAKNAAIANSVEDRYLAAERARREAPKPDSYAAERRAADSAIEDQIDARSSEMKQYRERKRLQNVPDGTLSQLILGPDGIQGVGVEVPNLRPFPQAATSAVVNPQPSVSPEMGGGSIPPRPPVVAAASSDPQPEKYQQLGYKFRPDGASRGDRERREVIKRLEKGAARRRAGLAAGAGAAAGAGLMALIGGERDKRDQEAQY